MTISRREFCEHLTIGAGLLAGVDPLIEVIAETAGSAQTTNTTGPHIGNLYPFVQRQADQSPLALSFLRPEFKSLRQWQPRARAKVFELLSYAPQRVAPQPQLIKRTDKGDYIERPREMTEGEITTFNQRSSQNEQLVARSLFTAGVTWPGIVIWDDIRTLDYLASRPEVDKRRLGCVGLSVGGWRSFLLAALDERIKAAVAVGWMTSLGAQIKQHIINSIGFSFYLNGLYRYFDLPDLAALIAPRAVLVINGSQDRLFALDGVKAAFAKIARCYAKAGSVERQRCSLYDAPHEFNLEMQAEAWEWIKRWI